MDYKTVLTKISNRVACKFVDYSDIQLVVIGGSIGDPYGYVTSMSDIDLLVWTSNREFITRESAVDWKPHKLKTKQIQSDERAIETVTDIEGDYEASILYRLFNANQMRKALEDLQKCQEVSRDQFDNYAEYFVESQLYKDEIDLYDFGRTVTTHTFGRQRESFARKTLHGIKFTMMKVKEDRELSDKDEPIDLRAYNDRVIDIVNAMTYLLCCTRNLPRSYRSIVTRRNNKLWEALKIDRNRINATMSSTETINKSYAALRKLVIEVCEEARREFPDIEGEITIVENLLE